MKYDEFKRMQGRKDNMSYEEFRQAVKEKLGEEHAQELLKTLDEETIREYCAAILEELPIGDIDEGLERLGREFAEGVRYIRFDGLAGYVESLGRLLGESSLDSTLRASVENLLERIERVRQKGGDSVSEAKLDYIDSELFDLLALLKS